MAKSESVTSEKIKFKARLSFLRLDKPKPFEEGAEPRWEATFLLDPADAKGMEGIKLVCKTAADVAKQAYGIMPKALKQAIHDFIPGQPAPGPKDKDDGIKIAFYSGDTKEYDGYAGMFVVPSHNAKMKPAVANRRGVSVEPGEEQYPYAGAFGIGSITIWAMENKYGRRLCVNLRGVQFLSDGAAFAQGDIAAEEEFDALEDEDTASEEAF